MNHASLLLLIITIGHSIAGQLSFFGEIHDGGYPSFKWLTTDFADSEHKDIPRKALKEEGKEKIVLKELSKPDNIVKRKRTTQFLCTLKRLLSIQSTVLARSQKSPPCP